MAMSGYSSTGRVAMIDGKKREYDACSEESADAYNKDSFTFIGEGTIYSIDGVRQSFTEKYYFFIRKDTKWEH